MMTIMDHDIQEINSHVSAHPYQKQLDQLDEGITPEIDASLNLDNTVTNWSDYNRVYYHPRSLNTITTHQVDDPLTPFDTFTSGRQSYIDNEKQVEIFDNEFRNMLEECDQLQGFHLLTGVDDGFGGFAEELLNDVRDEFHKIPIFTFGMMSNDHPSNHQSVNDKRNLNRFFSTTRLSNLSSIYIPMYTPTIESMNASGLSTFIQPNYKLLYHTSAFLSACIETATIPYRLRKPLMKMDDLNALLNWRLDTKIVNISQSLPLPLVKENSTQSLLHTSSTNLYHLSLPTQPDLSSIRTVHTFGESIVIRGCDVQNNSLINDACQSFKQENDLLQKRTLLKTPYPLPDCYPKFFSSKLDTNGFVSPHIQPGQYPTKVPLLTHMSTTSLSYKMLETQWINVKDIRYKDYTAYTEGELGIHTEDYLETREQMMNIMDIYSTKDDEDVIM
ncbi:unnamed protein product [Cunninghamella blakesleeana]